MVTEVDKVIDTSIGSESSTSSSEIEGNGYVSMTVEVDGDPDAVNLNVEIREKLSENDASYGYYDDFGLDLSNDVNNKRAIGPIDILDINDIKIVVTNNGANASDVKVTLGRTRRYG